MVALCFVRISLKSTPSNPCFSCPPHRLPTAPPTLHHHHHLRFGVSPRCMSPHLKTPRRAFHADCGFECVCVCVETLITTHPSASPHTHTHTLVHTESIGVQSGKGLSVMLREWPLLKQINRHWHVPPPTKRKQLKAIDSVPGSFHEYACVLDLPLEK